jgi:hypothetical protein
MAGNLPDKGWIFAVDDFIPGFDVIYDAVKKSDYDDAKYIGKDFTGVLKAALPVKPLIEDVVGHKIGVSVAILRKGNPDLPITHYIHADNYDATGVCVIYFNEPSYETGTMFWKHKETGLDRLPDDAPLELFMKIDEDLKDESKWEATYYIPAKANRAAFFDSKMFHSRWPEFLPNEAYADPRYNAVISYHPLDENGEVVCP